MTESADNLKELVSCPVCFEIYETPKMLTCMHTLCSNCTANLLRANKLECPQCRVVTEQNYIKNDFNKHKLVDIYKSTTQAKQKVAKESGKKSPSWTCDSCERDTQEVTCKCHECDKFMCASCEKVHKSFPAIQNHCIDQLDQLVRLAKDHLQMTSQKLERSKQKLEAEKEYCKDKVLKAKIAAIEEVNKRREFLKSEIDKHHNCLLAEIETATSKVSCNEPGKHQNDIENCLSSITSLIQSQNMKHVLTSVENATKEANKVLQDIDVKQKIEITMPDISVLSKECDFSDITKLKITAKQQNLEVCINKEKITPEDVKSKKPNSTVSQGSKQLSAGVMVSKPPIKGSGESSPGAVINNLLSMVRDVGSDTGVNTSKHSVGKLAALVEKTSKYRKVRVAELSLQLHRIRFVEGAIWCVSKNTLHIYNKDCDLLKEVKLDAITHAVSAAKTQHGTAIIACQNKGGLHELDLSRSKVTKAGIGSFSDVGISGNNIFALEAVKCKVFIFQMNGSRDWILANTFRVGSKCGYFDTLLSNEDFVFVCIWKESHVSKFSPDGTFLQKFNLNTRPASLTREIKTRLCEIDQDGNVLLTDYWNQKFLVITKMGDIKDAAFKGFQDNPTDCCIDDNGMNLWVLTRERDGHCLIKFSSE